MGVCRQVALAQLPAGWPAAGRIWQPRPSLEDGGDVLVGDPAEEPEQPPLPSHQPARRPRERVKPTARAAPTHPSLLAPARTSDITRRKAQGDGGLEALRILKRRLSDVVYRALIADTTLSPPLAA